MAYGPPGLTFADSPAIDAFGRMRVSQPTLLIDTKQVGGVADLSTSSAVTGSGATTYSVARSSTLLTVGSAIGTAIRQSKVRAIYQPGKSLLTFITFIFAPGQANLVQQVGLNDANDGLFLQMSGTTPAFVKRTSITGSPVDTAVNQSSWNIDKMDGTGPSGVTIDFTKAQIVAIDLEWLGVGRVRYGFVVNGLIYYAHQLLNANAVASVYIKNPNLPLRWYIQATGTVTGTPQLESICGSVNSEGGYDLLGISSGFDNGNSLISIANGVWAEVIAVRMRASFASFATAFVQQLTLTCDASKNTAGAALYRVVLNPASVTGGTWASLTNSALEKNTTRTGATGLPSASGVILDAGYFGVQALTDTNRPWLTLGQDLAGNLDVISLQVRNINLGTQNFFGSFTMREVY
jgi:hypothetical protein